MINKSDEIIIVDMHKNRGHRIVSTKQLVVKLIKLMR